MGGGFDSPMNEKLPGIDRYFGRFKFQKYERTKIESAKLDKRTLADFFG